MSPIERARAHATVARLIREHLAVAGLNAEVQAELEKIEAAHRGASEALIETAKSARVK